MTFLLKVKAGHSNGLLYLRKDQRMITQHKKVVQQILVLGYISDLRFEYSYLRSVLPYIQIERSSSASILTDVHPTDPAHEYERINIPGDQKETEGTDKTLSPTPVHTPEIIHIQWGKVIWITVRDQVVSPLLQGALWSVFFIETLLDIR